MAGTPILAIDLGKHKCGSCGSDWATAAEYRTSSTSRAEVERLIRPPGGGRH